MEIIDPSKIQPFQSKMPCLPQPDLFEELVLCAKFQVQVRFIPIRTEIGTFRAHVQIKSSGDALPFARDFFLYQRNELAAWLRQARLQAEMMQEYHAKDPPSE